MKLEKKEKKFKSVKCPLNQKYTTSGNVTHFCYKKKDEDYTLRINTLR